MAVVAVTTRHGAALLDADLLARTLGDAAAVVVIETGETTRALAAHPPETLCVYGRAGRIWWPGLTRDATRTTTPLSGSIPGRRVRGSAGWPPSWDGGCGCRARRHRGTWWRPA